MFYHNVLGPLNNAGLGLYNYEFSKTCAYHHIIDNVAFGNNRGITLGATGHNAADGSYGSNAVNVSVLGNVVRDNGGKGMYVNGGMEGSVFMSNSLDVDDSMEFSSSSDSDNGTIFDPFDAIPVTVSSRTRPDSPGGTANFTLIDGNFCNYSLALDLPACEYIGLYASALNQKLAATHLRPPDRRPLVLVSADALSLLVVQGSYLSDTP